MREHAPFLPLVLLVKQKPKKASALVGLETSMLIKRSKLTETIATSLPLSIVCIGNSMICSDIYTTSDTSKLLFLISRAVRQVKFEIIVKYHKWYHANSRYKSCYYLFILLPTKGL